MSESKQMRPRDVKRESQIIKLAEDNFPRRSDRWSILLGHDGVSLHPPSGESFFIKIPRGQFNAIVDWYMRPQTLPEPTPNE